MRRRCKLMLAGAVLLLGVSATGTAKAQVPGMWPWLNGYGLPYNVYGYSSERIPYYALHPPVYYSYPVPRPYGYSPFAYPPIVATPDPLAEVPRTIVNPYVPKPNAAQAASDQTAAAPRMIRNPFVDSPGSGSPELAAKP